MAAKDKKINLEDIERDNLKSERKAKQESKVITSSSYTQQVPNTQTANPIAAPLQYNFLPLKTAQNYAQQQQYSPQQYSVRPSPAQQYVPQQYTSTPQQQYTPPQQYYTTYQPTVQFRQYKQQYVEQPTHYQQYENVPLITDNSIAQQQPAYYTPRYVYVQPIPAASTSVQSVVDPKARIQYVMYIPTPAYVTASNPKSENALQESQEYVNIVPQTYVNYPSQQQEQEYETAAVDDNQYTQYDVQDAAKSAGVQYVKASQEPEEQRYVSPEYVTPKKQPKSLLDSYVPSYLQVQYYKQQQQQQQFQANAIPEQGKTSAGKTQQVKAVYRIPESDVAASRYVYAYQHPIYAIPGTRK